MNYKSDDGVWCDKSLTIEQLKEIIEISISETRAADTPNDQKLSHADKKPSPANAELKAQSALAPALC